MEFKEEVQIDISENQELEFPQSHQEVTICQEDDDVTAEALMTLHNSVQNIQTQNILYQEPGIGALVNSYSTAPVHESNEVLQVFTRSDNSYSLRDLNSVNPIVNQDRMNHLLGNLNNILKQSAGRRWVYYEWFYSNIDRALLLGENDFERCLKQLFKRLKTRTLTKVQWSMIRRLIGKPRRCSSAFFDEERRNLEKRRKKIRFLHQLKGFEVMDNTKFQDLPDEIPVPTVVGTRVTAKVNPEGNGLRLFTGTVDAVDTTNNTFRVGFERQGIESRSVPDIEVASEKYESMNLQLFIVKERPRIAGVNVTPEKTSDNSVIEETELTSSPDIRLTKALNDDLNYGGFPVKFLLSLTQLSKLVSLKKKCIDKLKEYNDEAELKHPFQEGYDLEFQKEYAYIILELEKINNELNTTFDNIKNYMIKSSLALFDYSTLLKLECDNTAKEMIQQSNHIVMDSKLKNLITSLTSLMLQISKHSHTNMETTDLSAIEDYMKVIKSTLHLENVNEFEDKIETNIGFILSGLQEGNSLLANFQKNSKANNRNIYKDDPVDIIQENGMLSSDELEEEIEDDEDDDDEDIESLEENDGNDEDM